MANDGQFKTRSRYIATRGVREYRATIPTVVSARDVVLEVGCEWGTTTSLLARCAGEVVGTDISRECVDRARDRHPGLDFRVLDAFDIKAVLEMGRPFTKMYMDLSGLSGYRGLLDLIALLNSYAAVVSPDTIVVKSGALKHFARCCTAWEAPAAE